METLLSPDESTLTNLCNAVNKQFPSVESNDVKDFDMLVALGN